MRYKIGDSVVGFRCADNRAKGYFSEKQKIIGVIVEIYPTRRFAVIDTGKYKECFRFEDMKLIKRKAVQNDTVD